MAGKKRTRNGEVKPPSTGPQPDAAATHFTPPCAQSQFLSSTTTTTSKDKASTRPNPTPPTATPKHTSSTTLHSKPRQKLPKLPSNATLTKRPLLHPALPTPFASSLSPKILYITATTPFTPCVKRVRKLLAQIAQRAKQSAASSRQAHRPGLEANGRLAAKDVERGIVEGIAAAAAASRGSKTAGGEVVYLKATGRAIPRALELGVRFQGEGDCWVRVEMGSVRAVDDIDVQGEEGGEDVPETRTRMVSCVSVSVGLR